MIDIKAILKKHNIGVDDLWKANGEELLLNLLQDCMTQTVISCIDQKDEGRLLLDVVDNIQKQISEIKAEEKPTQPKAWDETQKDK